LAAKREGSGEVVEKTIRGDRGEEMKKRIVIDGEQLKKALYKIKNIDNYGGFIDRVELEAEKRK
jgi:hypothetical protein